MSYSSILIHGSPLSLKSNASRVKRKPRANFVVCCCPMSNIGEPARQQYDVKREKIETPLPPGPSFLDLMGLMHYVVGSFPYHHPLRDLAKAYGPLVHVKLGEVSNILVSSAEIAKEVLKTRESACLNRPKSIGTQIITYDYTDVVVTPYSDYWKQMRNICISKFLSPKNVRTMEQMRKEEASVAIESISNCKLRPVNVTDEIFLYMNSMACRAVLGEVCVDRRDAIMAIKQAMSVGASFAVGDVFPSIKVLEFFSLNRYRMLKLKKKVDTILDNIMDDHRKSLALTELDDRDNFLDVLLRFKDKESEEGRFSITDDNIKAIASGMVAAATETSSSLVDWAMAELMRNPRVMEKAQDEIRQAFKGRETIQESDIQALKYLKLVIKETLRLHPPTAIITRACREEIEIEGYRIPLDATVIVNVWAIGRDPIYWENPESFEPERFEASPVDFTGGHFEFIPFGAGKRICPGMALGLANADYLLVKLLYHFNWKLPPGTSRDDIDMTETGGMAVPRKNNLYLIATPYVHAA
ncbi:hypothetical protein ACS0TY_030404 [Phlomoides rotata]